MIEIIMKSIEIVIILSTIITINLICCIVKTTKQTTEIKKDIKKILEHIEKQ